MNRSVIRRRACASIPISSGPPVYQSEQSIIRSRVSFIAHNFHSVAISDSQICSLAHKCEFGCRISAFLTPPPLFACHHVALRASSWILARGNYSNLYATSNPCAQSQTYTSEFSWAATSECRDKKSPLIICCSLCFGDRCWFMHCIMGNSKDKWRIE